MKKIIAFGIASAILLLAAIGMVAATWDSVSPTMRRFLLTVFRARQAIREEMTRKGLL